MKAKIKRQVEDNLQEDFDKQFESLQKMLKERDLKIKDLQQQHDQKETEKSSKEKEIR
jgi:hypothetical protein